MFNSIIPSIKHLPVKDIDIALALRSLLRRLSKAKVAKTIDETEEWINKKLELINE